MAQSVPYNNDDVEELEKECNECDGTGECPICSGQDSDCEACDGTGDCLECEGSGIN